MPTSDNTVPLQQRRGRGRPRVTQVRNENAIEKRRAQNRAAQRNYQARKNESTTAQNQRYNHVLQALADVVREADAVLKIAKASRSLEENGELGRRLIKLDDVVKNVRNRDGIAEQMKVLLSDQERYGNNEDEPNTGATLSTSREPTPTPAISVAIEPKVDMDLGRYDGTSLIQSFRSLHAVDKPLTLEMGQNSRSIFEIVRERQAEFHRNLGPR